MRDSFENTCNERKNFFELYSKKNEIAWWKQACKLEMQDQNLKSKPLKINPFQLSSPMMNTVKPLNRSLTK